MRRVWAGVLFACCALGCGREAGEDPGSNVDVDDASAMDSATTDARHDARADVDAHACDDAPPNDGSISWLSDDCLWAPVPELAICEVYEARLPSARYPTHGSTSCGTGCRWIAPSPTAAGTFGISSGWSDGSSTYVRLLYGKGETFVREIYDLTHDAVMASFEQRVISTTSPFDGMSYAQCEGDYRVTLGGWAFETWWFDLFTSKDGSPIDLYYARSRYRETSTLEPLGSRRISTYDVGLPVVADEAVGYLDLFADSRLHVGTDWTPSLTFTAIDPSSPHASDLSAFGDTFAWHATPATFTDPTSVLAWSPSRGERTIVTRDRKIRASALGADGFAWLESDASGSSWETMTLTNATLVRAFDGASPTEIAAGLGDDGVFLVTGGGYVAAMTASTTATPAMVRFDLVVVRIADGRVWRLGTGTAGLLWTRPAFVDATTLVVGATNQLGLARQDDRPSTRLYVLDVAQLDSLVATLATAPDAGVP